MPPNTTLPTIKLVEAPNLQDTDNETVRVYRAQQQTAFYGISGDVGTTVESLYNQSIKTRFLLARDALFPQEEFAQLYADTTDPVLTRNFEPVDNFYPRLATTKEILLPGYFDVINSSYQSILDIEEPLRRTAAFRRMASVVYALGIMIHPARDGNGQIFKSISLSYIQEGCSQYADRYFPLKISQSFNRVALGINSTFAYSFTEVPMPDFIPKDETETAIVDLLKRVRAIQSEEDEEDVDHATWKQHDFMRNRRIYMLLKENADRLGINTSELDQNLKPFGGILQGEEAEGTVFAPQYAKLYVENAIGKTLLARGYDEDTIRTLVFRSSTRIAKSTMALKALLGDRSCLNTLHQYVLYGESIDDDNRIDARTKLILDVAFTTFREVESEMVNLLDNEELSTPKAVTSQMQLGIEYYEVAKKMKEIANTDMRRYTAVWKKIDPLLDDYTISQAELIKKVAQIIDQTP